MRSHNEIYEHLLEREKKYREKQAKNSENRRKRVSFFGAILAGLVLIGLLIALLHRIADTGPAKPGDNSVTEYVQQTTTSGPTITAEQEHPKEFALLTEISADQKKGHASTGNVAPTETARISVMYSAFNKESGLVVDYEVTGEGVGTEADVDFEAKENEVIIRMESEHTVYEGEICVYSERLYTVAP